MQKVTFLDIAVELVFGIVIGCLAFLLVANGDSISIVPYPFLFLAAASVLVQTSADLYRGRGWRYSVACGTVFGIGIAVGSHGALASIVLAWFVGPKIG